MTVISHCKNINFEAYKKLIGRHWRLTLHDEAPEFLEKWDIHLYPLEEAKNFSQFYAHVEEETGPGIAWGVTMPESPGTGGKILNFIRDTRNPFILRSNMNKVGHENGHAISYIKEKGSEGRCIREFPDPGAAAGTWGPCYVVKVHDQYYGHKKFRTYWVRYGMMWLPVKLLDMWSVYNGQ